MPKQIFKNGKMTIELDVNDPKDQIEIKRRNMNGQPFSTMTRTQKDELLLLLCNINGIKLK